MNITTHARTLQTTVSSAWARRDIRITALYYVGFILLGLIIAAFGPSLSTFATHTQTTLASVSAIFITDSIGRMLGAALAGWAYDRFSGHRIVAVGFVALAISFVSLTLAQSLAVLVGLIFILGVLESLVDVGMNTLIVWLHGTKVGPYMNGLHFTFGIGAFLAPLVVAASLASSGDIVLAYAAIGVLTLPFAIAVARMPSPRHERAAGRVRARSDLRLVFMVGMFFFFFVGGEAVMAGWAFNYGAGLGMDPVVGAAALASAFWGAFTLGRLVSIPVSIRVSVRAILWVCVIGNAISATALFAGGDSQAMAWLGVIGVGFFVAPMFPGALTFLGTHLSVTGAVTGAMFIFANIGGMSAPWLVGQLFEPYGPGSVRWVVLVTSIMTLVVFALLDRMTARRSAQPLA